MKKLFAIFLALCMLASLLAIPVSADSGDVVIAIRAEKHDGRIVLWKEYDNFASGWNYAMAYSSYEELNEYGCKRVIVDIYADWNAVDGMFYEGDHYGFKENTIAIPDGAIVTLNLNGHTINRGLTDWEYDGEVISIGNNAIVEINGGKDANDPTEGTIRGGYSADYGAGISIGEGADVVLNYVNVRNNVIEDGDGAGIYLGEGSTLAMNHGSISDNTVDDNFYFSPSDGGGLYTEENTKVSLYAVDIRNNNAHPDARYTPRGAAIYARGSITLSECTIENNGLAVDGYYSAESVLSLIGKVEITNCILRNNGSLYTKEPASMGPVRNSAFVLADDVLIRDCEITGNASFALIEMVWGNLTMENCTVTDNKTPWTIYDSREYDKEEVITLRGCTFNNNGHSEKPDEDDFLIKNVKLVSEDSTFGDSTFDVSEGYQFTGSMFGNSSPAIVISLIALAVSICAIILIVIDRKTRKNKSEN